MFLELGPSRNLTTAVNTIIKDNTKQKAINCVRHPKENKEDYTFFLNALGKLWTAGITLNWSALHNEEQRFKVALPTYAFERIAYPINVNAYAMLSEMTSGTNIEDVAIQYKIEEQDETIVELEEDTSQSTIANKLLGVWQAFFGKTTIAVDDDFFDLGGDSLKAVTIIARIKKALKVDVSLEQFFNNSTIHQLELLIESEVQTPIQGTLSSSITKARESTYYPLSATQKRQYFLNTLDEKSLAYNLPMVVKLEGKLDLERIKNSFQTLIDRHESLRTSFKFQDGEPVQIIHSNVAIEIDYFKADTRVVNQHIQEFIKPFHLEDASLFRVGVITTSEEEHVLMIDMHHIISDGTSIGILMDEFMQVYEGKTLKPLSIQYKDYAVWEQSETQLETTNNQKEFWLNEFSDALTMIELPYDFERPQQPINEGAVHVVKIDATKTEALKQVAQSEKATLFMVLLAAYNVLLSKLSNSEDIVVGIPTASRDHNDLEHIVGMFVNTIPVRNQPKGNASFRAFLKALTTRTLSCFDNQSYHYEELVEALNIERIINRNPLFDTTFTFQNMDWKTFELDGLTINKYDNDVLTSQFDLSLVAWEDAGELILNFEYSKELFTEQTVKRFANYFNTIVEAICDTIDFKIADLQILSKTEQLQLIEGFNTTEVQYDEAATLYDLFHEQVTLHPNKPAVLFKGESITYKALETKANSLAHELITQGVTTEDAVGIYIDRSLEMIIAIMGILKSGGAYLPLDVEQPNDRITKILEDSNCNYIVTNQAVSFADCKIIDIRDSFINEEQPSVKTTTKSNNLAYYLYTSGSTGTPKGVMVEHRSVVNFIQDRLRVYKVTSYENILLFAPIYFDASVEQLFVALCSGAGIVVIEKETSLDVVEFNNYLIDHNVTHIDVVPSFLREMEFSKDIQLKRIVSGGEAIDLKTVNKCLTLTELHNTYGPTETTVVSTSRIYKQGRAIDHVTIGKPLANTTCYVLDKDKNLCPIGVQGELHIGGVGVSRGYANRPELTAKTFITSPFKTNERLYKTGDLVKWLPNGELEYLGRVDHQIKIRGHRIELGEIEQQLLNHPEIIQSVVVVKGNETNKYLVGYYTATSDITDTILKAYLNKQLPEYMVPSHLMALEVFPLTPNGKLDRKQLPEPDHITISEYQAPTTIVEQQLVAIWAELLDLKEESVGTNTSFFDIGGQSLNAMVLINKIHKALEVKVPLREVFKLRTIENLGHYISSLEKQGFVTITRTAKKPYYKLSSAQERLYFLYEFDKNSMAYNMPQVLETETILDLERLESSLKTVIERHESLRTNFVLQDGQVYQKIHEQVDFNITYYTIDDASEIEAKINSFIRPFDLSKDLLFRVSIITQKGKGHIIMFDTHHIISDGVSQNILINDFFALYQNNALTPLKLDYKDYCEWQTDDVYKTNLENQKIFWNTQFEEDVMPLELPTDHSRPVIKSDKGATKSFELSIDQSKQLQEIATQENTTLFAVLLSAYNILLSKLSNQEDIVIGTPVAGRTHNDLESILGLFVNTLPLRNYPKGNISYLEFLTEVKERTLESFENQDYQIEALIEDLELVRDTSRNPLFDVMFSLENFDELDDTVDNLQFKAYKDVNRHSQFDQTLTCTEIEGQLIFNFQYSTALYKEETIERFISYFKRIINTILDNKTILLGNIEVLEDAESEQLLNLLDFKNTNYPSDKRIHQLFEDQVAKYPNKCAIRFEGEEITYKVLNEKSNQLALILRKKGVKNNAVVALLTDRSIEVIIGMLAILKSGGAYLPIDVDYPEERKNYLLTNSKTKFVVTTKNEVASIKEGYSIIPIDYDEMQAYDSENISNVNTPSDLAYIIYTSGTTGQPKGVMISHDNVVRLFKNDNFQFQFSSEDVWTMFHSHCFDFSVWEIYGALLFGGQLIIIPKELAKDTFQYLNLLKTEKVTVLNQTPSAFYNLIEAATQQEETLLDLRYVIFGGEALSPGNLEDWFKTHPNTKLINMYGITETTVHVTYKEIGAEEIDNGTSTIGKPIPTLSAYIFDKYLKLVPKGTPGELFIAGAGVSKGYLNNEELTKEKFISNPYNEEEIIYKTGDWARILPNGDLEYLGRIDSQVKIRGYRIELGEIEQQLLNHPEITRSAVLVKGEGANKYLIGYYTSKQEITVEVLMAYLNDRLPEYMIPSHVMALEAFPLTSNGKLNRKRLPEPDYLTLSKYQAPTTIVEKQLVEIWAELLDLEIESIGTNTSFFEIGGHSLKATVLVNKIHKALEVKVPLREVFKLRTIKHLGHYISSLEKQDFVTIIRAAKKSHYKLSSAQERLYFLYEFDTDSMAYNMPQVLETEVALDLERLESSLKTVIERHESLRTNFVLQEGEVYQKIHEQVDFNITYHTIEEESEIEAIIKSFVRPFNLSEDVLFRVSIIEQKGKGHILMLDTHHIISDGVSQNILINDFFALYEGNTLNPITLQYKDYCEWQNEPIYKTHIESQRHFWNTQFEEHVTALELPTDYTRPVIKSDKGATQNFELSIDQSKQLQAIVTQENTTLFAVLLSAYNILLSKLSNQDDIVIGTPVAGRTHSDLQSVLGVFINTLPLRNYPKGDLDYLDFLTEVKERTLESFENQDYQIETLIEDLELVRDTSRNPLFDVMFSLQNFDELDAGVDTLQFKLYKDVNTHAQFDQTLVCTEVEDRLVFSLEYCTDLYKEETITNFISYFKRIINQIIEKPTVKIKDIGILSKEEQLHLIDTFNVTEVPFNETATLYDLFEEQVDLHPNKAAVLFNGESITYTELENKANSLAHQLRKEGVVKETVVGIYLDRSPNMIVAILGILKSGGAYLPLDVEQPKERIKNIIEDANCNYLIVDAVTETTTSLECKIINIADDFINESQLSIPQITTSTDLAYLLYTSGSTGMPKGVMVEQRSVVNLIEDRIRTYSVTSDENILLFAPIYFDASVEQLFVALFSGAGLVVIEKETLLDTSDFNNYVLEHNVTHVDAVPSFLRTLDFPKALHIKRIVSGGEAIDLKTAKKCLEIAPLYNAYGPTETTVTSTGNRYTTIEDLNSITIGKPLANTTCYVLDKHNAICPIGVQGELHIGGVGVSRGYVNNETLTNERFIVNPFVKGEKLYKTGDLVKWLPNGELEYLGRIDHQVKIRGYRIELGEIEQQLLNHPEVIQSVVLVKGEEANNYLVAYCTTKNEIEASILKDYLKSRLPEYMVPTHLMVLEDLPLTNNGKLDRKRLPEPNHTDVSEYLAPTTIVEKQLVEIWSELLTIEAESIGINTSFFEIGGHSLKATVLVNKIHKTLDVKVPLRDVFKLRTIENLGHYITTVDKQEFITITRAAKKPYYRLSSAQERLYFLYEFNKDSMAYNMPQVLETGAALHLDQLESSLKAVIERHESLRTNFVLQDGQVYQKIHNKVDFHIDYYTIEGESQIETQIKAFVRPFDLSEDLLFRVGVITQKDKGHILMFDTHHIISDGVSQNILINDFLTLYQGNTLEPIKLDYKDYCEWEKSTAYKDNLLKQKTFWNTQFEEEITPLELPTDFTRPIIKSDAGAAIDFELSEAVTHQLQTIATQENTTLFSVLLSTYSILLSKLSNQDDIIIGTPVAGRTHSDLETVLGLFVNTLALKNTPKSELSYLEFLNQVKTSTLESFDNQDYPLEALIEDIDLVRDTSRNPLFDVMFSFQNFDEIETEIDNLEFNFYNDVGTHSKFDQTLTCTEVDGKLLFNFEYSTALYKAETIQRFIDYLQRIINQIVKTPTVVLKDIDVLSTEEENQILEVFNNTETDSPKDKTVLNLFAKTVAENPEKTALVFEDETLTYSELDEKSTALALYLKHKGITTNTLVPICLERSFEMVIGILGVLKAGGAYVPVDPLYPEDRITYILEDTAAKLILCQSKYQERLNGITTIDCIAIDEALPRYTNKALKLVLPKPEDTIYVIYTSGTTGQPKGVVNHHLGVLNRLVWMKDYLNYKEEVYIQKTTFSFDVSVNELLLPIITGSKMVLAHVSDYKDTEYLQHLIQKHKATTIHFVPSMLSAFLLMVDPTYCKTLKYVLCSGEALKPDMVSEFRNKLSDVNIYNLYGPTEAAIEVTVSTLDEKHDKDIAPIGRPIANTKLYVVDSNNKLKGIGMPGELLIGGIQVANGYLNKPELTSEKFIPSPFVEEERLYKTGDLVKWLPNGELDYLGRIDDQVKIRGYRIELGEVEQQVLNHPEIVQSAVVVKGNDANKHLVGYYVATAELSAETLKIYLSEQLPEYMVPSYLIALETFPLTSNGKLDRRRLPEPDYTNASKYEAPINAIEEALVTIWAELLSLKADVIGRDTSFFDIGGHSLNAIVLINKIHKVLGVKIPLRDIFKYRTLQKIAACITTLEQQDFITITKAEHKPYYKLSSAQERLYFLYEFDTSSMAYNMPQILETSQDLNIEQLKRSINALIERHESLRTNFITIDGQVYQQIQNKVDLNITQYKANNTTEIDEKIETFIRPFNLAEEALIRVGVIDIETKGYIIMFDMHHIITDGVSQNILINEFSELYKENTLAPLKLSYKDYCEWQHSTVYNTTINSQKDFWNTQFEDEVTPLELPTDYTRPIIKSDKGAALDFECSETITNALQTIAKQENTTLFAVLLSIYNILLSKLSNQEDIVIGTPVAGRTHNDLEGVFGLFVNTLALRSYPKGELSFLAFLDEVKTTTLESFENQDYQLEALIEDLEVTRDTSRNPLFDVMFSLQNFTDTGETVDDLEFKQYKDINGYSKFDQTLTCVEVDGKLVFNFEYSTALYKEETIIRFISYFKAIIEAITNDTNVALKDISILSNTELTVLKEFNNTEAAFPSDKTIIELFENQVAQTPNNIAVVFGEHRITYKDLNAKANGIANLISNKCDAKTNNTIGLLFNSSITMVASILGVLKSGNHYLPLSPEAPTERNNYILEDAKAELLLLDDTLSENENCSALNFKKEAIITVGNDTIKSIKTNPTNGKTSKDLIYIIYTSGTTGKPKGVAVKEEGIVNYIHWRIQNYALTEHDVSLQLLSYHFDGYGCNFYPALLSGGTLVKIEKEQRLNLEHIADVVLKEAVTTTLVTPSIYDALLKTLVKREEKPAFKTIVLGGEKSNAALIKASKTAYPDVIICNEYGPTEASVAITQKTDLTEDNYTNIGSPIANTEIYILDAYNNLVPVGVLGELCVSGVNLAKGYVNNVELTAKQFIDHPFIAGEKLYKTGDLVKWLPNGDISYIGRIDNQVKIRGYRIELGAIEHTLTKHPEINQAAVIVKGEGANTYLIAYIVTENDLKTEVVVQHLQQDLPDYMIPSHVVELEKLPITSNGKLDTRSLPMPDVTGTNNYKAPNNTIEEELTVIWSKLITVEADKISTNKSFFELGGHSLKVMELTTAIYKAFGAKIGISEVFTNPTIQQIAKLIKTKDSTEFTSIPKCDLSEYYPAAPAQKRMYLTYIQNKQSTFYNIPAVIPVTEDISVTLIKNTITQLIERHESLRTIFKLNNEELVQNVIDTIDFTIEETTGIEDSKLEDAISHAIQPFNLENEIPVRSHVFKTKSNKRYLLIDMHHIACDQKSSIVLNEEFNKLITGETLAEQSIQYKDYAVWMNKKISSGTINEQKEYWLKTLSKELPLLNLKTDFDRPAFKTFAGDALFFTIEADYTKKINTFTKAQHITPTNYLLGVYFVLLSKLSEQQDIVIGSPVAGRNHPDIEAMIGMFSNTLVFRSKPLGELTFVEYIKAVQTITLEAFDNQEYQFDDLVEDLNSVKSGSRNPIFDACFNVLTNENTVETDANALSFESTSAKFDLLLGGGISKTEIDLFFEFSTELFKKETIEKYVQYYQEIIIKTLENPSVKLKDITVLSQKDAEAILSFSQVTSTDEYDF